MIMRIRADRTALAMLHASIAIALLRLCQMQATLAAALTMNCCNNPDSMSGFIRVLDTPYLATSAEDGRAGRPLRIALVGPSVGPRSGRVALDRPQ